MRRLIGLVAGLALMTVLGALAGPAAAQPTDGSTISGSVSRPDGPVDGVTVDLFAGTADGKRLDWLGATTSGQAGPGRFSFDTTDFDHGGPCWVVTFIAPEGDVFNNGSPWWNRTVCPPAGQSVDGVDASLLTQETLGRMLGNVVDGDGPVAGVQIDLFTAAADGTRGRWLRSAVTTEAGRFGIGANAGCYVLTYVAPEGRTFEATGTRWLNRPQCLEADDYLELPEVRLATTAIGPATIIGQVLEDGAGVPDVAVDLFSGSSYLRTERSDDDGLVRFEVDPGCYRIIFISPSDDKVFQNGTDFFRRDTCVEAGDAVTLAPPAMLGGLPRWVRVDFRHNGFQAANRTLEVYEADEAGNPGPLLASGISGSGGGAIVRLEGSTGCWVARAVAEPDETFVATGTRFRSDAFCLDDLQPGPNRLEIRYEVEIAVSEADQPIDLGPLSFTEQTLVEGELDGKARFYRVTGPPGANVVISQVACDRRDPVEFHHLTSDRAYLGRSSSLSGGVRCGDFQIVYPPIPDDGVLLIAVTVDQVLTPSYWFNLRLTDFIEETVEVTADQPLVLETGFADTGDRAFYVVQGPPGATLRVDGTANPAATCENWPGPERALVFRLTDSTWRPLSNEPCEAGSFPTQADGQLWIELIAAYRLDSTFTISVE